MEGHTDASDVQGRARGPRRVTRRLPSRPLVIGMALVGGGALAAACGSTTTGSAPATSQPPASTGSAGGGTGVHTAKVAGLGTVLVTPAGRTLYLFEPDKQKMVTCTAANGCTKLWPPLQASSGTPRAGSGVSASLLGTIKAPGGMTQMTYNHWPLYTFASDTAPGQANGEGINSFGGRWWAVTPAGQPAHQAASSGGSTTSSGSSGYGY